MIKICRFYFITVIFIFCFQNSWGQIRYESTWKHERNHLIGGIAGMGVGLYMQYSSEIISADEISTLSVDNLTSWDRLSTNFLSKDFHKFSHVLGGLCVSVPFVMYLNKKSDKKWLAESFLYTELLLYNAAAVTIVKYATARPRPYLYQENGLEVYELQQSSTAAFFSGHTSMAATGSFYTLRLFNRMYPDSNWKPYVTAGSIVIPAVVGYSRIRAGKHFLSDVIVGYVVGAASVYLQEFVHKNKRIDIGAADHGVGIVVWLEK